VFSPRCGANSWRLGDEISEIENGDYLVNR